MSEGRAKGLLVAAVIWCVILLVLGTAYKFLVHPYLSDKLKRATSAPSQDKDEIVVAADSFSGYAILRSELFKQDLRARQIKVTIQDDQADYLARLKALQEGKVQLAVFTVDSLITAGAKLGEFPATIVMVIDETKGGDAILAYEGAVASLQSLNDPAARIVLTPNSPSEFLARVVLAHFNLPRLPEKWWVEADGAREVYKMLTSASPGEKRAYVLWEPYVSRALQKKGVHVLLDSSRVKGYIVDVLVAQREFLRDHPDLTKAVVEVYLRAAYSYNQQEKGMQGLVQSDAQATGSEKLDDTQAAQIVQGILWKNTLENYAHFGLTGKSGVPLVEDIIANIVDVLVKTKAIASDPLEGKHSTLFYDRILAELKGTSFHPGRGLNVITDLGPATGGQETVRSDKELRELTDAQWSSLRPVGELRVEPIVFARGSSNITLQSQRDLQDLAKRLQSFPQFYMRVVGHTRAEGDPEANRILAQSRAEAAAQSLESEGLPKWRIKTEASPSSTGGGEAQAVSFYVGQLPY